MASWKDLIYYYDTENSSFKSFYVNSFTKDSGDSLHILGNEKHKLHFNDDWIEDSALTVYQYNEDSRILTKINENIYSTLTAHVAAQGFAFDGVDWAWIEKADEGLFVIVTYSCSTSFYGYFKSTAVIKVVGNLCNIVYESYADGKYAKYEYRGSYTLDCKYAANVENYLNQGITLFFHFSTAYIDSSTGQELTDDFTIKRIGSTYSQYYYHHDNTGITATVVHDGVVFNNIPQDYYQMAWNSGDFRYELDSGDYVACCGSDYNVIPYYEGWIDGEKVYGLLKFTYGTWGVGSTYESTHYLVDQNLNVFDSVTKSYTSSGWGPLDQPRLLYPDTHTNYGSPQLQHNSRVYRWDASEKISYSDMLLYDVYRINPDHDDYWISYNPINNETLTFISHFPVQNTELALSFYSSAFPDSSTGLLTFVGREDMYVAGVDKVPDTYSLYTTMGAFPHNCESLTSNIFLQVGNAIVELEYTFELFAEPTSITVTDEEVFIGATASWPPIWSGTYYKNGEVSTAEEVMSGYFTQSAIFVNTTKPSAGTLGDHTAEVNSNWTYLASGYALVKRYGDVALVHGSILPYRAVLLSSGYFEDVSYNLPSGTSSSVNHGLEGSYMCLNRDNSGEIYLWDGGETWELVSSNIEEVGTALITLDEDIYISQKSDPEAKVNYTSLLNAWEDADGDLPAGINITDFEEEWWNDR